MRRVLRYFGPTFNQPMGQYAQAAQDDRLRRMLVVPLVLGTVPLAAAGSAHAGPASNPAVVAASVAPDNHRVCKTSRVPVDLQLASRSRLGATSGSPSTRRRAASTST